MLVIACPGQGSQSPGFLSPWLDVPGFADRLTWLSAVAGIDLVAHGTTSDAETIRDTAVAQPLIVASGLVSLPSLFPGPADGPGGGDGLGAVGVTGGHSAVGVTGGHSAVGVTGGHSAVGVTGGHSAVGVTGGHSVGEITAAAAAGVLTAEQAMVFVRERGNAMAEASAVTATGMSAVVGGDAEDVLATIERHGLTAANANGAGQVVAAGTMEQLDALRQDPPAKARVIPLQVAGAFHTAHMAPAVEVLAGYARAIVPHDPRVPLVSNADGKLVKSGREVLDRLVRQVSNPVRWDLCQQTFAELGVTGLIELPPAGTLANLAKRALPGVQTLALKTPGDLDAARAMVEDHGAAPPGSPSAVRSGSSAGPDPTGSNR